MKTADRLLRMVRCALMLTASTLLGPLAEAQTPAPVPGAVPGVVPGPVSRGELLYNTHCIACHSIELHWRENKLANDWPTLKAQVQRWQGNAGLRWSEADVLEVARFLNDTIYHHEQTTDRVSRAAALLRLGG
jgi:mono/diheme cytochrome c family protein